MSRTVYHLRVIYKGQDDDVKNGTEDDDSLSRRITNLRTRFRSLTESNIRIEVTMSYRSIS